MQIFSVLAFVSAVSAIAIRQNALPPQCAFSCLTHTNTHGCSITDNSCLCRNAAFIAEQAACIEQACTNPADLQQAETFAQQNCLAVGVTLTASAIPSVTATDSSPAPTSPSTQPTSTAPKSNGAASFGMSAHPLLLAGVATAFSLAL